MRIKLYLRGGDEQKTPPRIARVGDGTGVTSMEALAELVVQDKDDTIAMASTLWRSP